MFKRMKLASKLALVLGIVLTLIFTVLISVTVFLSKTAISHAIYGELDVISKSNGSQIQQIFDTAGTVANNIQSYLSKSFNQAENKPALMTIPTSPDVIAISRSSIYDKILTPLNYNVEQFLLETARNTAVNNDDIAGIGALFEPYAFQSDMRDYAFYVTAQDAESKVEPFGKYSTYSTEAYYKDAAESKKSVVTDPYTFNGIAMISYAIPILYDNALQGVVVADLKLNNFSKVNSKNDRYPSLYSTIYDSDLKIVFDSQDTKNTGKYLSEFTQNPDELAQTQALVDQKTAFQIETTGLDGSKITRFFNPVNVGSETWWSLTAVNTRDVNATVTQTVVWLLALSIATLILIILTTVLLLRKMLNPMKRVVCAAESIAHGDLDVHVDVSSQDEIGLLSDAFQKMATTLGAIIQDTDHILGEMGHGNFCVRSAHAEGYVGDYKGLLSAMRQINTNLSVTLSKINEAADQVASGSDQVSSGAQALSQGATEQASSVEELAATINEISRQVKDTADHAAEARTQTNTASHEVSVCNDKMQTMITAMHEISEKSNEIGKIIKTIEDIAFQTNILALNAAVEAARAGTAGKGFAVVADEVRNLASKSAEASKSTSSLIEGSMIAVGNGTTIANETAQALVRVVEGTQSASLTVDKIADAATQQASSLSQITQGIEQISSVVQTNSATAEESAAASEELSGQAQMLKRLVSQFSLKEDTARPTDTPIKEEGPYLVAGDKY